jgi:subtilisin-like proprotein convertase family protein
MTLAPRRHASTAIGVLLIALGATAVGALTPRPKASRFDALALPDPSRAVHVAAVTSTSLPPSDVRRKGWESFRAAHGGWTIRLDRASGVPLLAEGRGIPWPESRSGTIEQLARSLRVFAATHRALLVADGAEMVLDREASGPLTRDTWQVVFDHVVGGVPVAGERYLFTIGHGKLISFGASRWSPVDVSTLPDVDAADARARLAAYMRLGADDRPTAVGPGTLEILPVHAAGRSSALVWRVALRVPGAPGTWEGAVDAHTGAILAFGDANRYAQAKGGVYPRSNDQIPPDGVEQAGFPMPYADVTIGGSGQTTGSMGQFACAPGGSTAITTLSGPYIKVVDSCGPVSQSVSCDADLDLGQGAGTDCAVPAGSSPGDTHAARTGFYHLNRLAEHARTWLPSNTWLTQQVFDNVNLNDTCNAYWDGFSVNFFKSGGGCSNSGEIAGIFLHEWGHGLDQNDGGGFDNPTEAYADVTSMLSTHLSCIGPGFRDATCTGYGDACLTCTGVRDQDWGQHESHLPATPLGFVASDCFPGDGPCGGEGHCESHVAAETMWDLAVRDLPASGLDAATSWQVADRLWYTSRLGSGGNAYNCSASGSDGCSATSWFAKLRAVDDDDGNLANGTPHAAAIFGAFDRHQIACGAAGDPGNQSTTVCPALAAPQLSASPGAGAAQLAWTAVPAATAYNVLRNDLSCASGSTIIATVTGTTYADNNLADGFAEYYTVQAVGSNSACDGPLSACAAVTPQPFAGIVRMDQPAYRCATTVRVTVSDSNIGAPSTSVTITSATETAGETITLDAIAPGSATYTGTIATTAAPPAADGAISVVDGDTITATYIDADDGQGGFGLPRTTTASIDCVAPTISNVSAGSITGNSAVISWDTSEPATSTVHSGLTPPPGSTTTVLTPATHHAVPLTGLLECSPYVYSVASTDPVGNATVDDAGGAYHSFTTGKNTMPSFASTDTPVAIPDDLPVGASSSITVTDNQVVEHVTVTLDVTHTFDRDLTLSLIPPSGAPITLATHRGGPGHDFTGTVFDDGASTPIAAGSAPFTGSFQPETPLSAAIGINAAGTWQLHAVDDDAEDVGQIDDWTLTLTYPDHACGPHAAYESFTPVSDICDTGGPGTGDGNWDAGERVAFLVHAMNDGTMPLTGVTATVTPTTPGVTMIRATAALPNLAPGTAADTIGPQISALLPTSLACGSTADFQVTIGSDQGSWGGGTLSHVIGLVQPVTAVPLYETFAAGIPSTWTVIDGGSGGGQASTWTTANPGGRSIAPPMAAPVAIVDSDYAGQASGIIQDEQLVTAPVNLLVATTVTLEFDQYFKWINTGSNEIGDVDVRSAATGGIWVNVLRQVGADSPNPDHKTLNISRQAAGAANVQVRFHYYNGHYDWYWQVDNVKLSTTAPSSCTQNVCAAAPGVAKPVPDGSFGTAMRASRADPVGLSISLTWDVATCSSTDHHVLYGPLASVASASPTGAVCDLGTTGSAVWGSVPTGNLWFVVVGDNDLTTEGSWGTTTAGERGGTSVSGFCNMVVRNNAGTCP